jgi:hypothetical protein
MQKVILTMLMIALGFQYATCQQQDSVKVPVKEYRNNVFVEGGGGSIFYSVGYERWINLKKQNRLHHLTVGTELSYLGVKTQTPSDMNANITLGYLYGEKHRLDTEIGLIWRINLNPYPDNIAEQLERKRNGMPHRLTFSSFYSIGIGYRYDGLKRIGFRLKPMYIFKYDFDENYLSLSLPYFDTAVYFKLCAD